MSINIIDSDSTVEYIYCDMCRYGDCLYKFAKFKQYAGWYCRDCYELIDEDAGDEDDNNFIITLNMLKTFIKVSNPHHEKVYYYKTIMCREIERMQVSHAQTFIQLLLDEQCRLSDIIKLDTNKDEILKEIDCVNKVLSLLYKYKKTYVDDKKK